MRKLAAAVLAVPVIALLYVPVIARRSIAARLTIAIGMGSLIGLAAIGVLAPRTVATAPHPAEPVPSARFTVDLRTNHSPDGAVTIDFSAPMDERSVAAALTVDPPAQVALAWDRGDTMLTVRPMTTWQAGTYYTVTVGPTALDKGARPIDTPARAAFVVRPAAVANLAVTDRTTGSSLIVRPDTKFVVSFDRPVDAASVASSLRIDPPLAGTFDTSAATGATATSGQVDHLVFTPSDALAPGTTYTVTLGAGARDAGGAPITAPGALTVKTAAAPAIVRFRPVKGSSAIDPSATLSVRFSAPMDRTATASAFAVTVGGSKVGGTISWAEANTVLVFRPKKALPAGVAVRMTLSSGAISADGVTLAGTKSATFRTVAAPAPRPVTKAVTKPVTKTIAKPVTKPSTGSAGGSAASGAWTAVEEYYLSLMNCTRTGGWVTSSGDCSSPGGRDVAPLRLDPTISAEVSRPYAKLLANRDICSHWADGGPSTRLARAGFTSYRWAENVGCYPGNPMKSMVATQIFFQNEKSSNGGHYVNMMNAQYDRVGIGVWVVGSTVRLVVDFYHP